MAATLLGKGGRRRSGRINVNQAARRQADNLPYVVIGEAPANFQHCPTTLQVNRPAVRRDRGGGGHDNFELMIGEGNHGANNAAG